MSVKFRPSAKDWYISDKILNDFVKEIKDCVEINREYDVPYVAGYNKKGNKIYIDRTMPKGFSNRVGKHIPTDKYLIIHEFVEKALEDTFAKLGVDAPYQFCHQIALRAEESAVKADKVNWNEYNDFMMEEVKKIGNKKSYDKVPSDLDRKPYIDENDIKTVDRMHTEGYNLIHTLLK